MHQSLFIIIQCLTQISAGAIKNYDHKNVNSSKIQIRISIENLIHHFDVYNEGFLVPKGDVYIATEAPKGEFGVYLVSCNENKPYRCKIKSPGFNHLQNIFLLTKNHIIADVVAIIGTLDVVFGEIDR
jgi:NADH:ubiquinone oxidoreductase subunit D